MPSDTLSGTAATMTRAGLAAEALVRRLAADPRVQRAYVAWCLAHGVGHGAVVDSTVLQSVQREKERDLATLDRLVRDELGQSYEWLAPLLLFDFAAAAIGEEGIRVTAEDVGLPSGRRPKADASMWRVTWIGSTVQRSNSRTNRSARSVVSTSQRSMAGVAAMGAPRFKRR